MRRISMAVFMSGMLLLGGAAFADHNDPVGSTGLLEHEAGELDQAVRYSSLNYNVKSAVFQFSGAVGQLVECVRYGGRAIIQDHTAEVGCPVACRYQLQNAQRAFYPVSRFLSDTQWDFPQVFQKYRQTDRALRSITVTGGPVLPPTSYTCIAKDRGWEEHVGGHRGYGRTIYQAQTGAMRECQRHHGQCVIQSCN